MRIVITGATGAVGTALIAEGIRQNVEMLVICRKASKRRQQIPDHPLVKVLELNMEEYETYQPPEGEMPYDVFYHFAWGGTTGDGRNDCELQEKNIRYALDAAALAKRFGCSAFVGAGSQAEYGLSLIHICRKYISLDEKNQYLIIGRNPENLFAGKENFFELVSSPKDGRTEFKMCIRDSSCTRKKRDKY